MSNKVNLLQDIQIAAIDSSVSLTNVLRKCSVLASRLRNAELKAWVNYELNGYPDAESLPNYRILKVHSVGHFSGDFGSGLRNAPIPPSCIPEEFRHHVDNAYITQPISSLITMLDQESNKNLRIMWPADLVALVSQGIYQDGNCLSAWKVVSRGHIVGIIDTVRNRILSFVLEIEAEAPDPGEWPSNVSPLPTEKVSQVFHTHIFGNVANVIAGSQDFSIEGTFDVNRGDFESLAAALSKLGLGREDLETLRSALDQDGSLESRTNLGEKVSAWIGSMVRKASDGTLNVAANVAAGIITQLILRYYGLA